MISATPKYIREVRRVLEDLVVHPAVDREGLRVGDLVGGDEPRAHRAERVERLAADPLAVAELDVPGRHVVEAGVAEDVVERLLDRHVPCRPADHDRELRLVVDLAGSARDPSGCRRPDRRPSWATSRTRAAPAADRRPPRRRARGSCARSRRPCRGAAAGRGGASPRGRETQAGQPATPATRRRCSSPTPRPPRGR